MADLSRNGTARRFGLNAPRLIQNEGAGRILPTWDPERAGDYRMVLEAWQILRGAGWSNQKVRRVFALIRSNNYTAGTREEFVRSNEVLIAELNRVNALLGKPPEELDPDVSPLEDEKE